MSAAAGAARVEALLREACTLDVQALKPGNVSVWAAGHGMHAAQFIHSATAAAPALAAPASGVGERILRAVRASVSVAACNTNLGIVLLAAPLVHAALSARGGTLPARVQAVLEGLDRDDARRAYEAIRLASPGGLGEVSAHDVREAEPSVTLRQAMIEASERDRVALQYATGYQDVLAGGVPCLESYERRWQDTGWALTGCYLRIGASWPDSHVARKHGRARAEAVRKRLAAVEKAFKACQNPRTAAAMLLELDRELKAGGVNPGTSADLSVASLLASRLNALFSGESGCPGAAVVGVG